MDCSNIDLDYAYYCRGGRRHHCLHGTRRGTRSRTRQHSNCAILGLCKQPQHRASGRLCRPIRNGGEKHCRLRGHAPASREDLQRRYGCAQLVARQGGVRLCPDQRSTWRARAKVEESSEAAANPPTSVGVRAAEQFAERLRRPPAGRSVREGCEDGTIPMRRLTPAELTRFATLKITSRRVRKALAEVQRSRVNTAAFNGHLYAHAYQQSHGPLWLAIA